MLVTGGTGFIGSHLVRRLLEQGCGVSLLVRPGSSLWRIEDILPKVRLLHGDLLDAASLDACLDEARPDVVYHLAGDTSGRHWCSNLEELDSSIGANLNGTLNLVRSLHKRKLHSRFVRAGGLAEYGSAPVPFDERDQEKPVSAYGASQAAATMFLGALKQFLAFPMITLRLASIYGPGRETGFFLPSLIVHCLESKDFNMTNGDQLWDLVYIDDAVDAFLRAAQSQIPAAPATAGRSP